MEKTIMKRIPAIYFIDIQSNSYEFISSQLRYEIESCYYLSIFGFCVLVSSFFYLPALQSIVLNSESLPYFHCPSCEIFFVYEFFFHLKDKKMDQIITVLRTKQIFTNFSSLQKKQEIFVCYVGPTIF